MKQIASALVKAQKAFGPALKTNTNPHFKTKYADLSACIEAVIDSLHENGIALIQRNHESASGVMVETVFVHESGETLDCGKLHVPAAKNDPQGLRLGPHLRPALLAHGRLRHRSRGRRRQRCPAQGARRGRDPQRHQRLGHGGNPARQFRGGHADAPREPPRRRHQGQERPIQRTEPQGARMNNITVAGPLGKDAELRNLSDGTSVLSFSVADSQGREKPTIWWNCSLFGKRAESLQQYLTKGQPSPCRATSPSASGPTRTATSARAWTCAWPTLPCKAASVKERRRLRLPLARRAPPRRLAAASTTWTTTSRSDLEPAMNLSLFNIAAEYREAVNKLSDLNLDEQTIADTLEGLGGDLQVKATNVAMFARDLEATAASIKDAEAQMAARARPSRTAPVIHYHGLPITPATAAVRAVDGGHAFVSLRTRINSALPPRSASPSPSTTGRSARGRPVSRSSGGPSSTSGPRCASASPPATSR
jgi:hypothetical protein